MAFSLRNLKIRDQVLFLVIPVLCGLLGILGLFFYSYWRVSRISFSAQSTELAAVRTDALQQDITEMSGAVQGYVFTRQQTLLQDYQSTSASVARDFQSLRDMESGLPAMASRLASIRKRVGNWKTQWADPAIEKAKAGQKGDAVSEMLEGSKQFAAIQKDLTQFRQANRAAAATGRAQTRRVIQQALVAGIVLAVAFGALLLVLIRIISRRITEPIHQMIRAADRVRQGDFDPALPPSTQNEFGVLSRSFLHMAQALRQDREELAAIKRFSEAVTECTSENEVYDQILHALRDRFHPNQAIIFKLRPEEDFLEAVASLTPLSDELQDWPVIEGRHNCKAVRMGRPFRVNDVTVEPLCPGKFALPTKGSYYCGPMIAGGIIIGAVRLQCEAGFWTPERESLVESYLSTTASVLSNLHLLQTMREQANIDPLTGLYNRRFCKDYARKLMAMARRRNTPLGFIMIDLDRFKNINDIWGHEVGDRILKQFAKTVTQSMRETNLTARLGGEEFVVLLPDTGSSACRVVAERIRKAVAQMSMPKVMENPLPQLTVSLGIAVYPEHGGSLEEMLHAADRALYESKRAGRNRTTIFVEEAEPAG